LEINLLYLSNSGISKFNEFISLLFNFFA